MPIYCESCNHDCGYDEQDCTVCMEIYVECNPDMDATTANVAAYEEAMQYMKDRQTNRKT